jgi:hypothetical protein
MGQTASAPVPTLDALDAEEQRHILRNVQLLASQNMSAPGRFYLDDFRAVHGHMPARLAEALWRVLSGGNQSASLDLDAVLRCVVPLHCAPDATQAAAAAVAHMSAAFPQSAEAINVAFDEAVPWLASVGRQRSDGGRGGRDAASAARVLADAAIAAWLVDMRQFEPLPELCEGSTLLLSEAHIRFLARKLPAEQRRRWRLLFTTSRDGCSFTRFIALTSKRAPCFLIVRDTGGHCFGGFAAAPLTVHSHFGGDYASFLFSLGPGAPAAYHASGENANLVYLNSGMDILPNGLAFGGNLEARFFGLWLRDDLESGRSVGACSTYSNAPTLSSNCEFKVDEIEVWAVQDDPPPPSDEEMAAERGENALTAAGVLSSKHEETRNFLAMAGRTQHAAALSPPPKEETRPDQRG